MKNEQNVPQVRFKGFTDAWEQRKVKELCSISTGKSNTQDKIDEGEYPFYVRSPIVERSNKYLYDEEAVLTVGDGVGTGKVFHYVNGKYDLHQRCYRMYAFFDELNAKYFYHTFSHLFYKRVMAMTAKTSVDSVRLEMISDMEIPTPTIAEQEKVGAFFTNLDNLITLHQRKCETLQKLKKSMLQKMFPKNGSLYPEIRFAGFTDAWEQRRFSELVLIERGGSPRPIDEFITDSPDGLNWVKIGDAPEQGNYITKTAEKIKPEGLSKTRQVQPGDLILSNSMSFGKPYIMAINGCIHDGWLLIRDTENRFDLKFLCHMLGTTQMLEQYKSLAAGSTVNNLNKELVGNTLVSIPDKAEQVVIGGYFEHLDNLITLHQRNSYGLHLPQGVYPSAIAWS